MSFTYDRFQQEAIDYIDQDHSVLVSAPTGAGKTAIAEYIIEKCLKKGERVIYTAPIKTLSNQKFRDFHAKDPDKIGILTGDVTINQDAPVLIMTTEIFRNKILEEHSSLTEYSWIIFDEIHYIDDLERGSAWEESLIFFPDHMNFLGLSATIPNIKEFAEWISSIHNKPVKIVTEDNRPVPLHVYYQCQSQLYDDYKKMVNANYRNSKGKIMRTQRLPRYVHVKPNRATELIRELKNADMLPCIYFAFSRKLTQNMAKDMDAFDFLNKNERETILKEYDKLVKRYDLSSESSAAELRPYVQRGIAYHHAGMLPTLKEVVEQLFTSRRLKLIFTTETFALGINMPAKAVIFDELRKFYGTHFGPLRTRDFFQMAGRAGRRGIDEEGFVFCRVNPHFMAASELHKIVFNEPEKVRSQFNASYATLLNLYQTYGEELYDIYPRSFHYFQVRKYLRNKAIAIMKSKVDVLKDLGLIENEQLTTKGEFASKVYGYELLLAELYAQGILEQLTVEELGVLIMAVVYEPRKGTHKPRLSEDMRGLESATRRVKKHIHRIEKAQGMRELSKRAYFHLGPAVEAWIRGLEFQQILEYTNADEGEIVRFFRMSIQVMREIMDAPVSDDLRKRLKKVIISMNRGVIDSEKQLRA